MTLKESFQIGASVFKEKISNIRIFFSSNKGIIGGVLSLLILTGALGAGVYLTQTRQTLKTKAGAIDLTLSKTVNPKVGDTFTVTVDTNTNGEQISAADLTINYEPAVLEAQKIEEFGTFLPTVLRTGAISPPGTASIALGALIDDSGVHTQSGVGSLAKITFKALGGVSSTKIDFASGTEVAAVGQSGNSVGVITPLTFNIPFPATPTATPTTEPTPKPSESPSPTPTPTATPGDPCADKPAWDVNCSGRTDIFDIGIVIDNLYWKTTTPAPRADVNTSGRVDIFDINDIIPHLQWGP